MLLDTLRMQRRLREVGFPDEQADVITEEIANLVTGELATKADLRELRTEMHDEFAECQRRNRRGQGGDRRGQRRNRCGQKGGRCGQGRSLWSEGKLP